MDSEKKKNIDLLSKLLSSETKIRRLETLITNINFSSENLDPKKNGNYNIAELLRQTAAEFGEKLTKFCNANTDRDLELAKDSTNSFPIAVGYPGSFISYSVNYLREKAFMEQQRLSVIEQEGQKKVIIFKNFDLLLNKQNEGEFFKNADAKYFINTLAEVKKNPSLTHLFSKEMETFENKLKKKFTDILKTTPNKSFIDSLLGHIENTSQLTIQSKIRNSEKECKLPLIKLENEQKPLKYDMKWILVPTFSGEEILHGELFVTPTTIKFFEGDKKILVKRISNIKDLIEDDKTEKIETCHSYIVKKDGKTFFYMKQKDLCLDSVISFVAHCVSLKKKINQNRSL